MASILAKEANPHTTQPAATVFVAIHYIKRHCIPPYSIALTS